MAPENRERSAAIVDEVMTALRALPEAPVALEALWDGDTTGWFVRLHAIIQTNTSHCDHWLQDLRFGGDIRVFHGQVPPWPEAETAQEVGRRVANELGVPFYFASPEHPEDDCPRWWEQSQGYPCRRCGLLLLQREPCPWRGVCHSCHLAEEREAKSK